LIVGLLGSWIGTHDCEALDTQVSSISWTLSSII
jgi:hypothetical protein